MMSTGLTFVASLDRGARSWALYRLDFGPDDPHGAFLARLWDNKEQRTRHEAFEELPSAVQRCQEWIK